MVFGSRGQGVDDLTLVSSPSVGNITSELGKRFDRNLIYTNIGQVLISMNPFTMLPIYTEHHIAKYQNASLGSSEPHIFQLAETAYRRMVTHRDNQAVIISGESGAGKTEAAKLILVYVSSVSGNSQESQRVKQVISSTNPILEGFGNAKTVRNDNSSRFGKYLEILFSANGEPIGAQVTNFLLEKSRTAFQGRGERNYHVFYYLCAGATPQMRQELALDNAANYAYLAMGGTTTVDGKDDAVMFQELDQALYQVGVTEEEKWGIYKVLAAILHLGNVQFQDGAEPPAQPSGDPSAMQWAAYLFGIDQQALLQAINHRMITTGGRSSVYYVPQNARQATQIRDALAKEMHSRMFDFLVHRINQVLAPRTQVANLIGILDIYGFEVFDVNSYEQFCINYVNEKLQQIFIDLTIKSEQQEYAQEGLKFKEIQFFDNLTVCELIDGRNPPGIMRVLDDTCRTAHSVDREKADGKFNEDISQLRHPHLGVQPGRFTIKHYAGDVTYDVRDFTFKNADSLFMSLVACVQTSNDPFVRSLWPDDTSSKQAPATSSMKIRKSATELVKKLRGCVAHYVRCIKSNDRKAAMEMNRSRCEFQVKYLGLLENVKVRRSGYAYRDLYDVFLNHFAQLMPQPPQYGGADGCKQLIDHVCRTYNIDSNEFAFGRTKLFISTPETIFDLEEHLFAIQYPEEHAEKLRQANEAEREAQRAQGGRIGGQKKTCAVM